MTVKKKIKATGGKTFHQIIKVKEIVKIVRIELPYGPFSFLMILETMGKKAKRFMASERNPKTCVTLGSLEAKTIDPRMAQFKENGEE